MNEEIKMVFRCSFCGKTAEQAGMLVQGPTGNICPDCIKDASKTAKKWKKKK